MSEELPQNGDVPMSPLREIGSLDRRQARNPSENSTLVRIAGAAGVRMSAPRADIAGFELFTQPKESKMNRRTTLAMTTTALLCLAVGSSTSPSLAQQTSLKEQLVGTWTLVSSDQVRPDGSKLKQFGANPNGINVFDANGRFFLMMASADNSRIASNDWRMTQSAEDGLIVESIAYYGTYTVNEEVTVISLHLDASTFPNQVGTDQKRTITSLTANELKYSTPAAKSGDQVHQVWKRAQ